jgi:SAM-dependent methyltransferase
LPGTQHRRVAEHYLPLFVELGGLRPDQAVLEPGCGTGRMAEALTGHLSPAGTYDGFDVVAKAVRWCSEHISSKHPNFRFEHVDVFNRAYNPKGNLDPTGFTFPYPDESFDFVFLTSVFTHMLPPEVRHYLREIRRVLRPEGRCLATFFLLNEQSMAAARSGSASRRFEHEGAGYRYDYARSPEAAIAYCESDVLAFLDRADLALHGPIRYGRWSGRGPAPNQDTAVFERRDAS